MNAKVRRTLILLAVSAALFTISEIYSTVSYADWIRGASAGLALAGLFSFVLILVELVRGK